MRVSPTYVLPVLSQEYMSKCADMHAKKRMDAFDVGIITLCKEAGLDYEDYQMMHKLALFGDEPTSQPPVKQPMQEGPALSDNRHWDTISPTEYEAWGHTDEHGGVNRFTNGAPQGYEESLIKHKRMQDLEEQVDPSKALGLDRLDPLAYGKNMLRKGWNSVFDPSQEARDANELEMARRYGHDMTGKHPTDPGVTLHRKTFKAGVKPEFYNQESNQQGPGGLNGAVWGKMKRDYDKMKGDIGFNQAALRVASLHGSPVARKYLMELAKQEGNADKQNNPLTASLTPGSGITYKDLNFNGPKRPGDTGYLGSANPAPNSQHQGGFMNTGTQPSGFTNPNKPENFDDLAVGHKKEEHPTSVTMSPTPDLPPKSEDKVINRPAEEIQDLPASPSPKSSKAPGIYVGQQTIDSYGKPEGMDIDKDTGKVTKMPSPGFGPVKY